MRSITNRSLLPTLAVGIAVGLATATGAPRVLASLSGPTEHEGIEVGMLAELSEDTMKATIGLEGYTMRMRAVGVAPGGQIAEHGHEDRPGIVTMVQGEWVEGRPTGEKTYSADAYGTFPEDEDTVHWVYNRTDAFATALVCDIAKVQ